MEAPQSAQDWLGLDVQPLPVDGALAWATLPSCGAVVTFAGTVRDHAEGRPGVVALEYEAYEAQVVPRLRSIVDEARTRWPTLGRIALLHRVGPLAVTDISVLVAVSAPHRPEAFDAARFCIDTLKASVPIWKHETWVGEGEARQDWGTGAAEITEVGG